MSFKDILAIVMATAISALATPVKSSSPPHILLIVADDYGWNDIGYHSIPNITCAEKKCIQTPTLDNLAASGVKMEQYYVQQVCSPTRGALMTGRYPSSTGIGPGIINPPKPCEFIFTTASRRTNSRRADHPSTCY